MVYKKRSGSWNKGKHLSEEHKKHLSEAHEGKQCGENNPFYGKHHSKESLESNRKKHLKENLSKETLERMVNSHIGLPPNIGCGWGKGDWFESKNNGKIWLRSTYEVAYAKWLDSNNIEWLYEIKAFKLSNGRTYRPDFYLIKESKFVDTKGYLTLKSKEKIELFKKEYGIPFEVLYWEDLKALGCDL